MKKIKMFMVAGFTALLPVFGSVVEACTGTTIRATNGDVVFCRSMEWDDGFVPSEILVSPRHCTYRAHMPELMPGLSWKGQYGVAGLAIAITSVNAYIDGMNEKGLTVGGFYHEGFAEYANYSQENAERSISSLDVISYLLSTCANIDEVHKALEKVEVVYTGKTVLGIEAPLHYMVTEPGGKQVVIEWKEGKPKFFDSKLGVIANSPTYDWHVLNVGNYIGLPSIEVQKRKMEHQMISALDAGTDLIGLPGDFTSPSRFVRASILTNYVRRTPDAKEAIYQAFQIMDSFNSPIYKDAVLKEGSKKSRSETSWTLAHDLTNRAFYYHTANDRMVQKVDVAQINFGKLVKQVHRDLDKDEMTILDRTGEISEGL